MASVYREGRTATDALQIGAIEKCRYIPDVDEVIVDIRRHVRINRHNTMRAAR